MSTHNMFSWRNKKNIMWIPSLICSYMKTQTSLKATGSDQTLKGTGHICQTVCHIYKGDNFCDFAVQHTKTLLKVVYSKRKEFAPDGSKFFSCRGNHFSEGRQKFFYKVVFLDLYLFPFTFQYLNSTLCIL